MANKSIVSVRIDASLKNEVDDILLQQGITPSMLIQRLYSEIRNTKKVPLSLSIPNSSPLSIDEMNKKQFDYELQKGIDDVKNGRTYTLDEAKKILKKDLGI